jgi:hypothetical protein
MEELGLQESWVITAYEEEEFIDEQSGKIIHIVPAYSWLIQEEVCFNSKRTTG